MASVPRAAAPVPRGDVYFRRHQQAAGFKFVTGCREMQRGVVIPEDEQKNQHEKTEFRFMKIAIRGNHLFLALTSAPLCSSRRQASSWQLAAE